MLKSDIVNKLVENRKMTLKQAEATVETMFGSMQDALIRSENIEIRGFGAFHTKEYGGYQGRNPKTGDTIPVKPKKGVLFRAGKKLKERINQAGALRDASKAEGT